MNAGGSVALLQLAVLYLIYLGEVQLRTQNQQQVQLEEQVVDDMCRMQRSVSYDDVQTGTS